MDRFDLCVLATGTIVIQPCMMYAAIAVVSAVGIAAITPAIIRRFKRRRARKKLQATIDQNNTERRESVRLAQLYPEPWLTAYKNCKDLEAWRERIILFNAWIGQKGQLERLPRLHMRAIRDLAHMVSRSDRDNDYARVIEKLSP